MHYFININKYFDSGTVGKKYGDIFNLFAIIFPRKRLYYSNSKHKN